MKKKKTKTKNKSLRLQVKINSPKTTKLQKLHKNNSHKSYVTKTGYLRDNI